MYFEALQHAFGFSISLASRRNIALDHLDTTAQTTPSEARQQVLAEVDRLVIRSIIPVEFL